MSQTDRHATCDERERLLCRYARHGRPEDLERLVDAYRPLARSLARRYAIAHDAADIEQAACEGLVKAIQRFDPERGAAFASFAVPTILGQIRRQRRDTAWLAHVPRSVQERVLAVRSAEARLRADGVRAPTVCELAAATGCSGEQVVAARYAESSLTAVPLDEPRPVTDGAVGLTVADRLGAEDPGYEHVEALAVIEGAMRRLDDRERAVLRLHFADELNQGQIASRLGVTRHEAARLRRAAIERLRADALPPLAA